MEAWIRGWIPDRNKVIILEPKGWFERGHAITGYTKNLHEVFGVHASRDGVANATQLMSKTRFIKGLYSLNLYQACKS